MSAFTSRTAAAAIALATLGPAAGAHAYCRLTTLQPEASRCPEPCAESGTPLAWTTRATYTFNENFIPKMSEDDVRRIFETSFGAWTGTECLEGPVDVSVTQDPDTTTITDVLADDNVSVIVYRSPSEWRTLHPGSSRAFALTLVAFTENAGRLVGGDMELNGGIGEFTECPDSGCDDPGVVDLGNVVTHEAGHFLGLAHSDVPGSTMSCDADPEDVDKRTLARDDEDGICAAYPGQLDDDAGGCQCESAPGFSGGAGAAFFALGLAAWLARRRSLRA